MRKIVLILISLLFLTNISESKIITFEKCYDSVGFDINEDYRWNEKDYNLANKILIYRLKPNEKYNPNFQYAKRAQLLSLEERKKLLNTGWEEIIVFKKNSISINSSNNSVSYLMEFTRVQNEWYYNKLMQEALYYKSLGKKNDEQLIRDLLQKDKALSIDEFKIKKYADGILIATRKELTPPGTPYQKYDTFELIIRTKEKKVEYKLPLQTRFLYCKSKGLSNSSGSSGTAFFINNEGNLVTNHHVVSGCSDLKVNYKKKEYKAKLLNSDEKLDIAVVKVDVKPDEYIKLSKNNPTKLQNVYAAGYPLGKGLSDDLKITSGIISSIKGNKDNINQIQIDAALNPGSSGGPIINQDGYLVGIAVSGMSKDKTESINFGIKSTSLEQYLNVNEIAYKKPFAEFSISKDRVLGMLEKATVYISCN